MNGQLQDFARKTLKDGLSELPVSHQRMFKLMYGRDNGKRSIPDTEAMTVGAVVDEMPAEKLDWAMQQVQRSLDKSVAPAASLKNNPGGID